jgi:ORF6N domain
MKSKASLAAVLSPIAQIDRQILLIRGHRVLADSTLAALYGVETRSLNQAVTRNASRFPDDFMFQLTWDEARALRSQTVILGELNAGGSGAASIQRTHQKYRPRVFTEQGVAMLSSVLRSERAVAVNIEVMRAFVRLRLMLASNAELSRKLAALEKKYDSQFKVVFDAIRQLMAPPDPPKKRPIGFGDWPGEEE